MGDVPGKPTEPLARIEDQIHNQLIRALHDDYLDLFDSGEGRHGEIKSMIELLLYDPSVDDSYIRDRYIEGESERKDERLESYIEDARPDTIPPPVNTITCSVRGLMKTVAGERKYKSTDEVVRFLARVRDEMDVAYTQYWGVYNTPTLYMEPSAKGPKAASTNVGAWFKMKFSDAHSIYHCFPSIDRAAHGAIAFAVE